MLKKILLIENDETLKSFFTRVFYIDGFEVIYLKKEEEINDLSQKEINLIDTLVIDECSDPKVFTEDLAKIFTKFDRQRELPILGILSKGVNPEPAHKYFDAVMSKDNVNIQLLADLISRLTAST